MNEIIPTPEKGCNPQTERDAMVGDFLSALGCADEAYAKRIIISVYHLGGISSEEMLTLIYAVDTCE